MNNVLLVGNGFDLAHGLPTSYNDFLFLMKTWPDFIMKYKRGKILDASDEHYKYLVGAERIDKNSIGKLGHIIQSNSWAQYYRKCEAEIDGWIDFEREIYPVIELFDYFFKSNHRMSKNSDGVYGKAHIEKAGVSERVLRVASLWEKYVNTTSGNTIFVKEPYASMQYGILKKKIIKSIRAEFEEFIEAFEIYLHEFVYMKDNIKPLKQIEELNINSVISFNYTLTEKLYGIIEEDVHHIHGMIRKDLTHGNNNMVMGVSETEEQNMDFIYFVKYFQRIQKSSGTKYKNLVNKTTSDEKRTFSKAYNLYIYGHSLDETDKDIITYLIGKREMLATHQMKPEHVTIFYYNDTDYEQKVINLIKLYGRDIVEVYMERNRFKFILMNKGDKSD